MSNKRWSLPGINFVARLFTISFSGLHLYSSGQFIDLVGDFAMGCIRAFADRFCHALTSVFSLLSPLVTSLVIGFSTSVIAVCIAVGILEYSVFEGITDYTGSGGHTLDACSSVGVGSSRWVYFWVEVLVFGL